MYAQSYNQIKTKGRDETFISVIRICLMYIVVSVCASYFVCLYRKLREVLKNEFVCNKTQM